jgi:hypothetical protein
MCGGFVSIALKEGIVMKGLKYYKGKNNVCLELNLM